jgi:serine/threonine protein kinase
VVALKKILFRSEQEGFPITALREIKLLKALKHPNVVEILDMSSDATGIYMVFPYMDHDLTGLLDSENAKFSIPQIKCYMKQLLEGIKYMHKCTILHRDIKGSNILLNNRGELRVTDFGLARPLEENRKQYTPGVVTRWYRPPELLFGATEYTSSVDLWGAGCILAEMHTRKPLLPGESDVHQLELITRLCGTPTENNMPETAKLPDFAKIRLPTCRRRIIDDFSKFDI